jgi:hypothetical protein
MLRTTTATANSAKFAAVCCEPTAAGGRGVARTENLAWVLFVPGLDPPPVGGDDAFTCATPGRASNATPVIGFYSKIGKIEDASTYTQGGCYVLINRCCAPTEVEQL